MIAQIEQAVERPIHDFVDDPHRKAKEQTMREAARNEKLVIRIVSRLNRQHFGWEDNEVRFGLVFECVISICFRYSIGN